MRNYGACWGPRLLHPNMRNYGACWGPRLLHPNMRNYGACWGPRLAARGAGLLGTDGLPAIFLAVPDNLRLHSGGIGGEKRRDGLLLPLSAADLDALEG